MSVLFIDTNCELWHETAKELGITNIIRMPYTIGGKEYYYDLGENFNPHEYFQAIRDGSVPITSCLNAENYREYFEPAFQKGEDILYISFSSQMSGTFAFLDMAIKDLQEKYPSARFRRFDTKGISMGAGLSVYAAAKLYNQGKSFDEIIEFLNTFIYKVNATCTPDDLMHLKRGGRVGATSAIFGTLLQIKPIIRLSDEGKLEVVDKVKGRKAAINNLVEDVIANVDKDLLKEYPIVLLNADCRPDADLAEQKIKASLPEATIWHYNVGPVIGTHCGPGTFSICFVGMKRTR